MTTQYEGLHVTVGGRGGLDIFILAYVKFIVKHDELYSIGHAGKSTRKAAQGLTGAKKYKVVASRH